MRVTITDIQNKISKNGNDYKVLTMDDSKKYTVFGDKSIMSVLWSIYDITTVKGKNDRDNIDTMVLISKGTAPEQAKSDGFKASGTGYNAEVGQKIKNDAIAVSVAIQQVGECIRTKGVVIPESASDAYWAWIDKQLNPKESPLVTAAKESGAVEKADEGEVVLPEINTVGDLLNKLHEDYGLNRLQVERKLGKSLDSVKDFLGAFVFVRDLLIHEAEDGGGLLDSQS